MAIILALNMKVSYVVIAYNTEKYIGECIKSILAQKHHKEVIIINDGSTDDTLNVIKSFGDQIILVNHLENKGCCASRMEGMSLCSGDYMTFIDSDDYYLKDLPVPKLFGPDIIDYGIYGAFDSISKQKDICSNVDERLFDEEIWRNYRDRKINELLVNKLISKRLYKKVVDNLYIDDLNNYCDNFCIMSCFAYYAKSYICVHDTYYFYRQATGMNTYLDKLEMFKAFCGQKKAVDRLVKLGMPFDSLMREVVSRAYEFEKWME